MHSCYPTRIAFAVHRSNWKENVCATQCNKQYHFSRNLILTVLKFSSRRAYLKLTPRQLRNWVSIFLLARGMHFPLCNLKEWTSIVYKVWADVARHYAATKSRHQTTVRPLAHQIFNKSKMHGIRQTRLTALSHTITPCHVNDTSVRMRRCLSRCDDCRVNARFGITFTENGHVQRVTCAWIGRRKIRNFRTRQTFWWIVYLSVIILGFST